MLGLPRLPLTLPRLMAGVSEDLRSAWQRCERRQKEENARGRQRACKRSCGEIAAMDGR